MKIPSYLIVLLGIIGAISTVAIGPTQDRVSPAYLKWKANHERELAINHELQKIILDNNFRFDQLELVEVAAGKKYYSLWGHLMLRFKGSGNNHDSNQDLVLSFLADFNDFPVDNFKASIGGYTVLPKIGTVEQYKKEYEAGEGRSIKFHPIKASIAQKEKLLLVLRQWIEKPELAQGYSFFYNNCVSLMIKLFNESDVLQKSGLYGYWPKYVTAQLKAEGIIEQ
jgi:Domain of unknown function (DUF4105)